MYYKPKDLARRLSKSGDTGTPGTVFFLRPVILENAGESPPVPGGDGDGIPPVPVLP